MIKPLTIQPTSCIQAPIADWLENGWLFEPQELEPFFADDSTKLYHGDAVNVLRKLPTGIANCIITSPAYWSLRDYAVEGQMGLEKTPQAYISRLIDVFVELHRVMADDATAWIVLGDSYATNTNRISGRNDANRRNEWGVFKSGIWNERQAQGKRTRLQVQCDREPKNLMLIPHRFIIALQETGLFYLRSEIVWEKPNAMPSSVKDRPTCSHEHIFLLSKRPRYFFNPDALRENCITGNGVGHGLVDKKRFGGDSQPTSTVSGYGTRTIYNHLKGRAGRTVWRIPTEPFRGDHPAAFPRKLVQRCMLAGCPEGGLVLDPFIGSGTVAEVAKSQNRRCIGIDLNPKYLDLAVERIQRGNQAAQEGKRKLHVV